MKAISTINDSREGARSKASPTPDCDVAVIGAGPYGLSAGAYLKAGGTDVRVFGEPMEFWANKMPVGMLLRSPRPASSIAAPRSEYTLEAYEQATGLEPSAPVKLETFVNYGRWFQHQLSGNLDRTTVKSVSREASLFRLKLQNGQALTSRRVVVAAGVGPFARKPKPFSELPAARASHCYEGRNLAEFAGRRVAVIGAGQSALESAALLHESGADVELIARISQLRWIGGHKWLHHLGPISHMLYSKYDVGPAGISRLVSFPGAVFHVPLNIKDKIRTRAVRPAGAPWLIPRLVPVKISAGRSVQSAKCAGNEVSLKLDDGTERRVDHVLLGTGYRVDISQYQFLSRQLVSDVRQLDGYPLLTAGFCSSVPGLHFVGASAAKSFGPLLYFVAGTEFASGGLATYISSNRANVLA